MKSSVLLRTATLALFIVLMSGFVAYKAGAFERTNNEAAVSADSPVKDSVARTVIAPGSKSSVLFEPQTAPDTAKPKRVQQQSNQQVPADQSNAPVNANQSASPAPKPEVFMGGSKSAPVFTPTPDTSGPQ
jgi:hypothetical protein